MQQLPLNIRPSFTSSVRKYLVRWRQRTERHHRRELRACQREQLECELEEIEENLLMDQVMKEVVLGSGSCEGGGEGSGGGAGSRRSGASSIICFSFTPSSFFTSIFTSFSMLLFFVLSLCMSFIPPHHHH